ncbi:Flagellar biosynthetic protein FliQ [Vibrio chagasii]|nr:Flagellar biosynthetic protein FliQ [Vibrio chagasii]
MEHDVVHLSIQQMMSLVAEIAIHFMAPTLVIGLTVAIFQAATQINEQSLSFIPKLVALFFVITTMGTTLMNKISSFTTELFAAIPTIVG